jgi:type VI protein secretion system component VasF
LGANAGLLSLPSLIPLWRRGQVEEEEQAGPMRRSPWWIATGLVASLLFVFVLGHGITVSW